MIRTGLLPKFSKTFVNATALLEKVRIRCPKISKNGEERYRTFKKKFAKVAGLL